MEEEAEGHCDSDVSDSWSIVDFRTESAASALKNSTDSGFLTDAKQNKVDELGDELDECFELTEMTQLSFDPLSGYIPVNNGTSNDVVPDSLAHFKKKIEANESDIDTDGISVISEDEEYTNWKQAAHDNYQKTMRLLESPETTLRAIPTDIATTPDCDEDIATTPDCDEDIDMAHSDPEPDSETIEPDQLPTDIAPISEDLLPVDESWQERCSHFLTKHFFTSAVIAALTCIALAQFFKTGTGKDKVAEMLEVLERLKGENEVLKFQLQGLSEAYTTLEARMISSEPPVGPTPLKEFQPTIQNPETAENVPLPQTSEKLHYADATDKLRHGRAKDVLPILIKFYEGKDPQINTIAKKLQGQLEQVREDTVKGDFKVLEKKIVGCVVKLLKRGTTDLEILKRLSDLSDRLAQKIARSKNVKKENMIENNAGLNIVQWFPEDGVSEQISGTIDTPNSIPIVPSSEPVVPKTFDRSRNSESNVPPKPKQVFKDSRKKCKSNKCEKVGKKLYKVPKIKSFVDKGTSCDPGRNKTGAWFFERGRGRENIRRVEEQGQWQFAKGRWDLRKEADEKALWYIRRLEVNGRSRQ